MRNARHAVVGVVVLVLGLVATPIHSSAQPRGYADVGQVAIPLVGLAASAVLRDRGGVRDLFESMAVTIVVSHGLKRLIDADRPNGGNHSFPSAHTAAAFTGSAFLWRRHGWKAGLPATFAAAAVGSSRVQSRDHRWIDVVAGAAVGVISARIFTGKMRVSPNGGGLNLGLWW